MLPKAHVKHHVRHRTRIQIPSKRKARGFFSEMKKELLTLEGVEKVESNPATGSVLIHHQGPFSQVADFSKRHHLFELDTNSPDFEENWVVRIFREVDRLDEKIANSTGGNFRLMSALAVTFFGLGVYQAGRGRFLPAGAALWTQAFAMLATVKNMNHVMPPEVRIME